MQGIDQKESEDQKGRKWPLGTYTDSNWKKAATAFGWVRGTKKEIRVVSTQKLGEETLQSWDLKLRGRGAG